MEYKNNTLTIVREMHAPADAVWKALTDIAIIKQWLQIFPDFKPEVGFEIKFLLGPDKDHQYLHIVKVTEVVKNEKLSYTWAYDGQPGDSLVTFALKAMGGMTEVMFMHTILKPFPDTKNFSHANFIEGWTYTVDALQKFVEKK